MFMTVTLSLDRSTLHAYLAAYSPAAPISTRASGRRGGSAASSPLSTSIRQMAAARAHLASMQPGSMAWFMGTASIHTGR